MTRAMKRMNRAATTERHLMSPSYASLTYKIESQVGPPSKPQFPHT